MRMRRFWAQNGPFAPQKFFWENYIILIYLLPPFIVQILKKFFQRIQSYEDVQLLDPKWPISVNDLLLSPCKSTCQKSKSDINLLVKY